MSFLDWLNKKKNQVTNTINTNVIQPTENFVKNDITKPVTSFVNNDLVKPVSNIYKSATQLPDDFRVGAKVVGNNLKNEWDKTKTNNAGVDLVTGVYNPPKVMQASPEWQNKVKNIEGKVDNFVKDKVTPSISKAVTWTLGNTPGISLIKDVPDVKNVLNSAGNIVGGLTVGLSGYKSPEERNQLKVDSQAIENGNYTPEQLKNVQNEVVNMGLNYAGMTGNVTPEIPKNVPNVNVEANKIPLNENGKIPIKNEPVVSPSEKLPNQQSQILEPTSTPSDLPQKNSNIQNIQQQSEVLKSTQPVENQVLSQGNFSETTSNHSLDNTIPQIKQNVNNILQGGEVKERGFVTSVKEGRKTTKPLRDMVDGTYVVKSDSERISHARQLIKDNPDIAENMALNPRNDTDITIGNQLIDHYLSTGQFEKANQLVDKMAESGTEMGRAIHAFADYDKTTPQGALKFAKKTINAYNKEHPDKKLSLKDSDIKTLIDRAKLIQDMPEGKERNIASQQLIKDVNNFIPSTIGDKLITIWKAGLLTSPRTTLRNLVGNTVHGVAEFSKDIPAVLNDMILKTKTGNREMSLTSNGVISGAKKGIGTAGDVLKFGFDPEESIKKFDVKQINWGDSKLGKTLGKYTDFVFNWMGAQDKPFYHASFARSLYDQAGAIAINSGKRGDRAFIESLVANPTDQMLKNATQDASVATFKDANKLGELASAFKKKGGMFGEIVAPFTGVPSSVAGQMVAYSPVGLIKGIGKDIKIFSGKVTAETLPQYQRMASQEVGRGVIGTGLIGLGVYLTKKGLMTGQPKDANEAKQWELEGKQANSVMINGKWRSINSIGPEALILLAGSKSAMSKNPGEVAANIGKDFTSQTFLSGVQQPLNAISDPARYGGTYLSGQISSAIPNIVKDTAKSFDNTQRESYVPGDTKQSIINSVQSSIPLWRNELTPKRDVLGNTLAQEPTGLNSFVDLFNSKTPINNTVVNELSRLYTAGNSATPSKLSNNQTISGNKINFTPQELDQLEQSNGIKTTDLFKQVMNDSRYSQLSDEDKAKILNNIVDSVRNISKLQIAQKNNLVSPTDIAKGVDKLTDDQTNYLKTGQLDVSLPTQKKTVNLSSDQINQYNQLLNNSNNGTVNLISSNKTIKIPSVPKAKKISTKKIKIKKAKVATVKAPKKFKVKTVKAPEIKGTKLKISKPKKV